MSPGLIRALLITDPLIILATIILGMINLAVSVFDDGGREASRHRSVLVKGIDQDSWCKADDRRVGKN